MRSAASFALLLRSSYPVCFFFILKRAYRSLAILAIFIIQLLMTLSVKYIQQCCSMCCGRRALAVDGTPGLTFHVLKTPTEF
jgi:hypothetical protein